MSVSNRTENSKEVYLGIDVGGTNVKMGIVDPGGTMLAKGSTATPPLKSPENICGYAMEFANSQLGRLGRAECDLVGVGLAVPGVLDTRRC